MEERELVAHRDVGLVVLGAQHPCSGLRVRVSSTGAGDAQVQENLSWVNLLRQIAEPSGG